MMLSAEMRWRGSPIRRGENRGSSCQASGSSCGATGRGCSKRGRLRTLQRFPGAAAIYKLVGGLEHEIYFSHHIGNVIIPTDEVIFFRGVGLNHQPADASQAESGSEDGQISQSTEPKKDGAKNVRGGRDVEVRAVTVTMG